MSDAQIRWNTDRRGMDLVLAGADLAPEDGLATAVVLSLFTDARAEDAELPLGEIDPRGWWGDGLDPDRGPLGSKLWLLERSSARPDVLPAAEEAAREALAWLISEGHARSVDVVAEWVRPDFLGLRVRIDRRGEGLVEYVFEAA